MGPIGPWELVIILVFGLIILGPKKLPEIMRSVGKGLHELRKASTDFQRTLEREIQDEDRKDRLTAERLKYATKPDEDAVKAGAVDDPESVPLDIGAPGDDDPPPEDLEPETSA
jgi:sec-independent protein translocase protein TatB